MVIFITIILLLGANKLYTQNSLLVTKKNWGFTLKYAVFDKNKVFAPKYGNTIYTPQYGSSYTLGFTYDVNLNKYRKNTSLKFGVFFGTIPVINGKFKLSKNDVNYYGEDYLFDERQLTSFMVVYVPLKYEYKIHLDNNILNFNIGPQVIFVPEFDIEEGSAIIDNNIEKEIYASYITSDRNVFVDIQSSVGLYYKVGRFIFNTELEYNLSLKNKFKGEYQFGNLNISEPTRGNMEVSGSYLGLSLTVFLNNKKV